MNLRRSILAILLLLSASVAAEAEPATLTMHIVPAVSASKDVSLRFRLRYDGREDVEVEASTLPGVQRRLVIALDVRRFPDYDNPAGPACTVPKEIITIDDPGPGWQAVHPGEEFVQDVRLADFYEGVEQTIGQCELVVNWSYKMYTRDKFRFPRMSGSVVVPSSRQPVLPPDIRVTGDPWKHDRKE